MFIIEMTTYESDFCKKSTKTTGAYRVRTFDVNHTHSLFAYYYEDHVHLTFKRYNQGETTMEEWERIEQVGLLFPDIDLMTEKEVWMQEDNNQIHVKVPTASNERRF